MTNGSTFDALTGWTSQRSSASEPITAQGKAEVVSVALATRASLRDGKAALDAASIDVREEGYNVDKRLGLLEV